MSGTLERKDEELTPEQLAVMYDDLFQTPGWKHFCEALVDLAEQCNTVKGISQEILDDPMKLAVEVKARRAKYDAYIGIINRAKKNAKKVKKTLDQIDEKKKQEAHNA